MKITPLSVTVVVGALATVAARSADPAPKDFAAGKKLYTAKCARCHKFYDPAGYDDKAWESWMQKMRDKAKISDEQYGQLSAYLQSLRVKETK
jgi:mono/diheme cytochrome c family protein